MDKKRKAPNYPPKSVLDAFNVSGEPRLIEGGQNKSFLIADIVIKPAGTEVVANWAADILSKLEVKGLRIARPVPTKEGKWIQEGWSAYKYTRGKEVKAKWEDKLKVSDRLHQALAKIPKPDFIGTRTHPWGIADRMIWGDEELKYDTPLKETMERLVAIQKPLNLENQIIHGDLSGNILFHEKEDPAIIDFSVYWRPANFAKAIIMVDAIVWEKAPMSLINKLEDSAEINQLLIRAAMWRIKSTEEVIKQYGTGDIKEIDAYHPLIDAISKRKRL